VVDSAGVVSLPRNNFYTKMASNTKLQTTKSNCFSLSLLAGKMDVGKLHVILLGKSRWKVLIGLLVGLHWITDYPLIGLDY
jgi:hypothetical protein